MKKILLLSLILLLLISSVFAISENDNDNYMYWSFDNKDNSGSNPLDLTPNNNDGTNNGATIGATGIYNEAYTYDGDSDYVIISGNVFSTAASGTDATMNFWVKTNGLGGDTWFVLAGSQDSSSPKYDYVVDGTIGTLRFCVEATCYDQESDFGIFDDDWHMITVKTDGTLGYFYVDGVQKNNFSESSTLTSGTSFLVGEDINGASASFNGEIDELSIWNKTLTEEEISYLYASGAPDSPQQYPFAATATIINDSVESTAVVKQISDITLTGIAFSTIFNSDFNVTINNTDIYGAYSFNVLANNDNEIFCELLIDSVVVGNVSRNNENGVLGSVWIQSGIFTLTNGTHNQELRCRKIGAGLATISNTVGIGHFMIDEDLNVIPHSELLFENTTSSSSVFTEIASTNFTISNRTTGGAQNLTHHLVLEWSGNYANNAGVTEILNTVININGNNCSFYPRTVSSGGVGSVSGDCLIKNATKNQMYNVTVYGLGSNADFSFDIILKEFLLSQEEIEGGTGFPVNTSFTGLTRLFNFTGGNLNHGQTNVFQKNAFSIRANESTTAIFYVKLVDGNNFTTINFTRDITTDIGVLIGHDVLENVPQDNYVSELWAECGGNAECTIVGGDGIGYITDVTTTLFNAFNVSVFDNYDNSVILEFNVTDGATFSTTTGSLLFFTTQDYENLTINSNDYFSYSILNHNTSQDLIVNLNQTLINFICSEKITGNSLNCSDNLESRTFNPNVAGNPHSIVGNSTGYFSIPYIYNIVALQNETLNISNFFTTNLTLNSQSGLGTVSNCNYTIQGITYPSYSEILLGSPSITVGLINGSYNITADCVGSTTYSLTTEQVLIENSTQSLTFDLFTTNSINITFYDINTLQIITGTNITVQFIGATSQTNITNTGNLYVDLLNPSEYTIVFDADNYRQNSYIFTLADRSFTRLNLYMDNDNNTQLGLITVMNTFGEVVSNADVVIQRYFDDAWQVEQIKKTDFQGRTEAYFVVSTAFYNFLVKIGDTTFFGVIDSDENKKQIYTEDINSGIKITISTSEDETISSYQNLYDISTDLNFINQTNSSGYFRFYWDDSNNIARNANLVVNDFDGVQICNVSSFTSVGTLFCFINTTITKTYSAFTSIDGEPLNSETIRIGTSNEKLFNWGAFGFGVALLIILISMFMFSDNPTISVLSATGAFIGLILLNVIFYDIKLSVISLIAVLGWIVASINSKNGVNT